MAAMLRSYKILRLLPQITRINSRSGYQQLQTVSARTKQSLYTVDVARALSTHPSRVSYEQAEDHQEHAPSGRGPLPRSRMVQGRLQDDVQVELRRLDDMVQKTGRLTERKLMNVFDKLCQADSVTPNQALLLIRSCGSLLVELPYHRRNELVMQVWDKLAEQGLRYDVTHYNALLWVYLENEHTFSPTEFLAQMESKGIEPNRVTYQRLINAFCRQGDIKGATLILEVLKSKDLPVTEGVFNSLIMGNARAGNMEDAKNMLNVMRDMGLDPSLDTFTALACAYAEKGDIDNINAAMKEAEASGFTLTPSFYFKIVNSLTSNGHKEHIGQFLDQVNLTGFIPDAINLCLSLWTQGYFEESFAVLKKFTTVETESRTTFFITHMMNSEKRPSSDALLDYLGQMQELGLHKEPYTMSLSHTLQMADADAAIEMSLPLMRKMKEQGLPIRLHYFWPLFVKESNRQNKQGLLRLLGEIKDMGLRVDVQTLKEYIFPTLKGKGSSVIDQLKEIGFQDDIVNIALCSDHLVSGERNAPREALTMFESNPQLTCVQILNFDIARYFARAEKPATRDLVKLMQFIVENRKQEVLGLEADQDAMETETSDVIDRDNPTVHSKETILGALLYNIVNEIEPSKSIQKVPALKDLFRTLAAKGMHIPLSYMRGIRRVVHTKLNMRSVNASMEGLVSKEEVMQDPFLNADFLSGKEGEDVAQILEAKYREDSNANPRTVLIKLVEIYALHNNTEKVNELVQEMDSKGLFKNVQLIQSLIQMHCRKGNLEEALKIKESLTSSSLPPSDAVFYSDLAILMIEKKQVEDAMNMLQDFARNLDVNRYPYFAKETVEKVLNKMAEMGLTKELWDMFERCVDQGLVKPEKFLLQPLVNVHLHNNDLNGAIDAVADIKNRYDIYPSDQDLLVKLIASGDKDLQKKALQNMNEAMGEVNMIYSLTFAFLENKKFEEAEKLMKAPGIDARVDRLKWFAERCIAMGHGESLEKLVELTDHLYGIDKDAMQFYLMRLYSEKENNPDKCMEVYNRFQDSDIIPSTRTLRYLANVLEEHGRPVPFEIPAAEQQRQRQQPQQQTRLTGTAPVPAPGPRLQTDPTLSAPDQIQAYLKQFEDRDFNDKFYGAVRAQVQETAASGDFQKFLAVKEVCQKIPKYTDGNDFIQQELRVHIESNDLSGAQAIYSTLVSRNQEPYRQTLFNLVSRLANEGNTQELQNMKAQYEECFPNRRFRYSGQILAAYAARNDIPGAFQWAEDQITNGVYSRQLGFTYFFSRLLEQNNLNETVTDFVDSHLQKEDPVPARSLVHAYVMNDRYEEAKQMIQSNDLLKGSMVSLAARMTGLAQKDVSMDKLYKVLEIAEIDGSDRGEIYSYVLRGYDRNGDWQGGLRVRQDMATENLSMSDLDLKRLAILLRKNKQEVSFQEPPEKLEFYMQQLRNKRAEQNASVDEEMS